MSAYITRTMRRLGLLLGILAVALALVSADAASAKQPLRGETDYAFVGEFVPGSGILVWEGTISGDIGGCIQWWAAEPPTPTGQASHYDLRWEVWDECDGSEGTLLLAGSESGSTTVRHGKNSNWRTNGVVTEASDAYAEWIGRPMHQSGNFTWTIVDGMPVPNEGIGIFRAN